MKYHGVMATSTDVGERFSSRLAAKADRFISELLASALENGWRTPEGFLDHFSVENILEALADEDDLRVRLLVETTGTHEKIAAKKSPMSAAEDVRLALDEGTTTPQAVFRLFNADDWVRLLHAQPVWGFLTEDKFWNVDADDSGAFTEALERVCETVHCAIQHQILREVDVIQGVGFDRLVPRLDESQLRDIVVSALEAGARNEPFSVSSLLDVVSLEGIIEKATLGRAWHDVIVRFVEEPLGLGAGPARRADSLGDEAPRPREPKPNGARETRRKRSRPSERTTHDAAREAARAEPRALTPPESARRRASASPPRQQSTPPPAAAPAGPAVTPLAASVPPAASAPPARGASSAPPPRTSSAPPPRVSSAPPAQPPPVSMAPVPAPAARVQSLPPPPPSARAARAPAPPHTPSAPPPPNDPSLVEAVQRLGRIDRLPARHNEFPGAVIHAIESMYGELATVSDAQQQLSIIRDAFPNDAWRSRAMLALLELLSPGILTASPGIAQESADALSVRLLTEERQLSRQAAQRNARQGAG
jgi:hypothetical protein